MRYIHCSWLQTTKKEKMRHILKNIKTSFFGSIAGLPLVVDGIANKDVAMVISGVATLILGLMAKDHDTH